MRSCAAIFYCTYPPLLLAMSGLMVWALAKYSRQREAEGASVPVCRLLLAGFVSVSAGYLLMTWGAGYAQTMAQLIDDLRERLGFAAILLGLLLTFDMLVLSVAGRASRVKLARASELR